MKYFWMAAAIGFAVGAQALADVPALSANPFERPAWLTDAREVSTPDKPVRGRLDLRATLTGERPMVNVGGRILSPGEEVEGYRLLAVTEGAARFGDGNQVFRVTVLPDDEEQDDD